MGKYCDSKVLERNWFNWLVASSTPSIDSFRNNMLLWTKVSNVKNADGSNLTSGKRTFPDPCSAVKEHCVALPNPIYFISSSDGVGPAFVRSRGTEEPINLKSIEPELNLHSDCWVHFSDDAFVVQKEIIPSLMEDGYKLEHPTEESWHAMLRDINNMCQGIATKFNPPSVEEHMELSQEALLHVIDKLTRRKLVFTPGRAPVFNLLTTTIYRCMYSIKNKHRSQRNGMYKLMNEMQASMPNDSRRNKTSKQSW
jgi:hypothetical protein